jgi:PKD repeat protein
MEVEGVKKVFIGAIIAVLLLTATAAGCAGTAAPEAGFSASPTSGDAPLTVNFTDQSTGEITSWAWDFGDGSTSKNPSHTYQTAGTYTVSLEVTGPGGSDTEIKTGYVIVGEPEVITAEFSATPTSGNVPLEVQFTDQSTGEITSWVWDFGNGGTSSEQNPSHTYEAAGTYTVSFEVTGPGGSDTETKTDYITVTAPPVAPEWTYEVSYTEPDILLEARGYPDPLVTTCQVMLLETDVVPQDMAPAASVVPVPQVLSSLLEYDLDYGGEAPVRFHGGMPSTSVQRLVWLSSTEGVEVYSSEQDSDTDPTAIPVFGSTDYTLLSGSNIGKPYAVGNSWSYTWSHQVFAKMGTVFVPVATASFTMRETVTAENESVTVAAGTFDDCFVIERENDYGEGYVVVTTTWYSPTVEAAVKIIDELPADGIETWTLQSYTLIP